MDKSLTKTNLEELFKEQMQVWQQASDNYAALERVESKEVIVNGFPFRVQFNPARIVSSAAKVDSKSITERRCFLCAQNRPAVQKGITYECEGNPQFRYTVLINPFPIFPKHLTIPLEDHTPQLIGGRVRPMLKLAKILDHYTLFYNGPKCGASAPDHFHFQAGNKGFLPIEKELGSIEKNLIASDENLKVYSLNQKLNGVVVIESNNVDTAVESFNKIYSQLPVPDGEMEPMLNILSWYEDSKWTILIYLRIKHRPSCFFAEGDENILLSPASVDLGGVLITPLEKDYIKIAPPHIESILGEVLLSFEETTLLAEKIKKIFKQ